MKHFNELTPEELERLALLAEECAEVIQIINKIIRHGYESHNPFDEDKVTNRKHLEKELGHFENAARMMMKNCDVRRIEISEAATAKKLTIDKWLHHQSQKSAQP